MREAEIRPESLLKQYLELSLLDGERCFAGRPVVNLPCVACGGGATDFVFEKNGFLFSLCSRCGTLFQNPRATPGVFLDFYLKSESTRFWSEVFFPAVAEPRRKNIFQPRVEIISGYLSERGISAKTVIDIGAGFGVFLDEWKKKHPETRAIAVEPSVEMAEKCEEVGIEVYNDIVENLDCLEGVGDLAVCYEVLEHVYDPLFFLKSIRRLVRPGGFLLLSTLCVDGFDIQVLWDKSKSVFPPHHINFLSRRGFFELFSRAGFGEIEITTPGKLDVDIVRNARLENPSKRVGGDFLDKIINDEKIADNFQRFLVVNRLSSHAWVFAKAVHE